NAGGSEQRVEADIGPDVDECHSGPKVAEDEVGFLTFVGSEIHLTLDQISQVEGEVRAENGRRSCSLFRDEPAEHSSLPAEPDCPPGGDNSFCDSQERSTFLGPGAAASRKIASRRRTWRWHVNRAANS